MMTNPNLPNDKQDADEVIDDVVIDRAWNWYIDKYGKEPPDEMTAYKEYVDYCSTGIDD
jgi:hypothetical protein